MELTPEEKDLFLKWIEKIEKMKRPQKWREIKKFTLALKPWLKQVEHDHSEACKELRQKNENKYAASKSGDLRNSMKLFGPVYQNLIKLDPEFVVESSGRNKGSQELIGKQLWDAFPEWRICREF